MILADMLSDNLIGILGLGLTLLGMILGGLIHSVRLMTELKGDVRSLRREFEQAGKDSLTARDSVRLRVDELEKQMTSLRVECATWFGAHPKGA